jgi:hypothetical protein
MTEQQREPVPTGVSSRRERAVGARGVMRRPGMVTFAAVMMFVVAGFEALLAITEFAGTGWWVTATGDLVYANFVFWGIIDSIIAIIALYAGIDLLRGGDFGLVMGYLFAGLGALRWLFYIPITPVLAVVVIALCVMVIYGLAKHSDYFQDA